MKLEELLEGMYVRAVIFDLDGTLIDNNAYHLKAWKQYLANIGKAVSDEEYNANMNGRTNKDVIEYIYGNGVSAEDSVKYTLEKEAIYRELYQPHIVPVRGLLQLLEALHKRSIPMAIATSGIEVNINFMFDNLPIRQYFKHIVNSTHIRKGKPDPEIYNTTASLLQVPATNCLVFEDAVVGINSAKAAGMKVIALATTHPKEELTGADRIINDYLELL